MSTPYRIPVLEKYEYQQRVEAIQATPPVSPFKGQRCLVDVGATGAWVGKDNQIAWHDGSTWKFDVPEFGWMVFITSLGALRIFQTDSTWQPIAITKAYVDGLVAGLLDDRGGYDASGNTWPSTGGSGTGGAIMKGDLWFVSVAGTLGDVAVSIGDSFRALVDTPGQTNTNWNVLETNIGFTPENVTNKSTDGSFSANSDTLYPSQKATKTYADTKTTLAQVKADADIAGAIAKTGTYDSTLNVVVFNL